MERRKSFCLVKNTAVSLSSAEAEFHVLKTGISEGMVTKHLLNELGHEATLVTINLRRHRHPNEVGDG